MTDCYDEFELHLKLLIHEINAKCIRSSKMTSWIDTCFGFDCVFGFTCMMDCPGHYC
jgi:hypothetical protein